MTVQLKAGRHNQALTLPTFPRPARKEEQLGEAQENEQQLQWGGGGQVGNKPGSDRTPPGETGVTERHLEAKSENRRTASWKAVTLALQVKEGSR